MARREFAYPLVLGIVAAAIGAVPCLYGHSLSDQSLWFDHNLVFRGDFDQYFSFIRQSAEGRWLFHNQFTPEPHGNVFFNLEFLAVGKLAVLLSCSIESAYVIAGALAALLFVFSLYRFSAFVFETLTMRRLVTTAIVLGGGFGWLKVFPAAKKLGMIDTYLGLHPFFGILLQPHFLIAQALSLLSICFFLQGEKYHHKRDYVWSGLVCAALGAIRPYDMLYLFCVFSLYTFLVALCHRERSASALGWRITPILIAMPVMLYYLCLFQFHPVFRWWSIQGMSSPPPMLSLALGMGFIFVLLLCSLDYLGAFYQRTKSQVLVACCILCGFGLIYSFPIIRFSGQLVNVLVIPSALLGAIKLEQPICSALRKSNWAKVGLTMFLALNSLTSLAILSRTMREIQQREPFIPTGMVQAYRWLQDNSHPREVILGAYRNSNSVPHYCRNSCVSGYLFSTVDFASKKQLVERFYRSDNTDDSRRRLLEDFKVRYVFWGFEEKGLGSYDPNTSSFLRRVFCNEATAIYEVVGQQ